MKKLTIKAALAKVRATILDEWNRRMPRKPKDGCISREVSIETWLGISAGLRVHEVSFVTRSDGGIGGSSFMVGDSREADTVAFLVERLVLNLIHFPDDVPDTQDRLMEALFD